MLFSVLAICKFSAASIVLFELFHSVEAALQEVLKQVHQDQQRRQPATGEQGQATGTPAEAEQQRSTSNSSYLVALVVLEASGLPSGFSTVAASAAVMLPLLPWAVWLPQLQLPSASCALLLKQS